MARKFSKFKIDKNSQNEGTYTSRPEVAKN